MNNELAIRSINDVQKTAEIMVASGFFKDARDVAKACVKILAGQELGIDPVAAMRGIDIVEGQVSLRAHLMGGMIKRSGKYNYKVDVSDNEKCVIGFYEEGERIGESTFTMDDAKRAGLAGKGTWAKYPAAMLYNRAMSQGARMYCPDIFLGGVYYDGEIEEAKSVERDVTPPEKLQDRRSGLAAAWNAETQEMDVYQPVSDPGLDDDGPDPNAPGNLRDQAQEALDADDIPDSMTANQRGKLLGMFKQLGVRDGDKRELLDRLNLDKHGASALIDKLVAGGAEQFPWQVLSVYLGILKSRTGKTNEDIADYCKSQWGEKHPAYLKKAAREDLFDWLDAFTKTEGSDDGADDSSMDDMAAWIEASGITSEQLSRMSNEDIAADVETWRQLQAHKETNA